MRVLTFFFLGRFSLIFFRWSRNVDDLRQQPKIQKKSSKQWNSWRAVCCNASLEADRVKNVNTAQNTKLHWPIPDELWSSVGKFERTVSQMLQLWERRDTVVVHVSLAISKPPTERHDVDDAPPPPNRWCQLRKLKFHWEISLFTCFYGPKNHQNLVFLD